MTKTMHRLIALLLSFLLLGAEAARSQLTISELHGFNAGGGGPLQFVGYTTSQGTTTLSTSSLSGGVDTSIQAGDLVVVAYHVCPGSDTDLTLSGAGYTWTENQDLFWTDANPSGMGLYWTIAGAGPSGNLTMSGSGSAARGQTGILLAFRNANATQFDAATTTVFDDDGAIINPASITTVTNGAIVLAIAGGCAPTVTSYSPPSGYTQIAEIDDTGQTQTSTIHASMLLKTTAGAEDPGTMGGSSNGSATGIGLTVAIRP